jgi:hypothetical protein
VKIKAFDDHLVVRLFFEACTPVIINLYNLSASQLKKNEQIKLTLSGFKQHETQFS